MKSRQNEDDLTLSFEFFPARDGVQERRFWRTVGCLETVNPEFFSMTYGALGSERKTGLNMIVKLCDESSVPVAAHLTCAGKTETELNEELDIFVSAGVNHIVALRGDENNDTDAVQLEGRCRYASDLVALLRQRKNLQCSVAAYPEVHPDAVNAEQDMNYLRQKLDLGAKRAITQFFFDPDAFLRFRDRAIDAGITKPIVPGILPIHDIEKVISFSSRCGAHVPVGVVDDFRVWSHDAAASRELAISHCQALCETLRQEGVNHFHFYTLNQSDLSYQVSRLFSRSSAKAEIVAA